MKTKIIFVESIVIIILLYFLFSGSEKEVKVVEKIVKVTDTIWQTKPQEIKKVYVSIPEKTNKKQTKEFIYKDTLKNGVLNASIFADTIYNRRIKLITHNKETTIEKIKFKPSFYFAPTIDMAGFDNVQNIELKAYLSGGKLMIGSGVGVNLETQKPYVPVTIGFRF